MDRALPHYSGKAKMQRSPVDSDVPGALPMCSLYFFCTSGSFSATTDRQETWRSKTPQLTLHSQATRDELILFPQIESKNSWGPAPWGSPQDWSALAKGQCQVTQTRQLENRLWDWAQSQKRGNLRDQKIVPLRVLQRHVTPGHESHLE